MRVTPSLLLPFLPVIVFGQLDITLSVENQHVIGSDFYFDIFLHRSSPDPDDIYLAGSDFVLDFNQANFSNPTFAPVGISPGYCSLTPSDHSGTNDQETMEFYFDNASIIQIGGSVVINLSGPTPNMTTILTHVARIDATEVFHRLGRFKISGIINSGLLAGLIWKTGGLGLFTRIFSFDPITLIANEVDNLIGEIESCPSTRPVNDTPISPGVHQAVNLVISSGTVDSNSSVTFDSGNCVKLMPNFAVEGDGVFEIKIQGCN